MRGCLTSFFIFLAGLLLATWLFAPTVAAGLVSAGLGGAGFSSADKQVTVTAEPPIELLTLHADTVHLQATDATFAGLHMAGVDLILGGVGLLGRSADSVVGTLTGVRVPTLLSDDASTATISSIGLSGPSSDLRAILTLSAADIRTLVSAAVQGELGAPATKVTLAAPDKVTVVTSGVTVRGRLVVDGAGGLAFLVASPPGLVGSLAIIRPSPTQPLHFTSIALRTSGATITATVDPSFFGG